MRKCLDELRKASGLSQKQVAEQLNIDQTTVSKWENGDATPRTDKLFLLAILYNVKVDEIYLPKIEKVKEKFFSRYQDLALDERNA